MFKYILKKEFLLIFRDIHAMLVLFIMPSIFIIIMSLALKNTYSNEVDVKYKVAVVNKSELKEFKSSKFFEINFIDNNQSSKENLYQNNYDFVVNIPNNFKEQNTTVETRSDMPLQYIDMLKAQINSNLQQKIIKDILTQVGMDTKGMKSLEITHSLISKNEDVSKPTSVQQSVPAWLVFSMFFILIPISNTFINEKQFGTIDRMRSINVSFLPILVGKIIPYYVINQFQVLFMILMGMFLMPYLGADALAVKGSYFLVFLISSVVSLSAISFALIIANIAKTSEEASTIGGLSNIILAALGGIMVPKFVMPLFMQDVSELSPMSWALESFLEIFVRGGSFEDIQWYLVKLGLFSFVCLFVAFIILNKKRS